jgi:integrase
MITVTYSSMSTSVVPSPRAKTGEGHEAREETRQFVLVVRLPLPGKALSRFHGGEDESAAGTVAAEVLTSLTKGNTITNRSDKAPSLREFATRFLTWADGSSTLKPSTRRYYQYGWRLLSFTKLASMPINQIMAENIDVVKFRRPVIDRKTRKQTDAIVDCSPAYTAQALRTLKTMMGKAKEWKVVMERASFTIPEVPGRDVLIDNVAETAIQRELSSSKTGQLRVRHQAWLVTMIMQDSGMRPSEVFAIRLEDIYWATRRIWIPSGKTKRARRFVGMSERMHVGMSTWCSGDAGPGWLFPSPSKAGHILSIASSFKAARDRAGLDTRIVPYCARHTYGTDVMEATGNLFAVSKSMGHADIKSMEPYQHQKTEPLVIAINQRNANRAALSGAGHTFGHTYRNMATKSA